MSDLLIHSMSEFADIILPCLERADARTIVEIGAEYGGMSQRLADHTAARGGSLTSIDPSPQPQFLDWVARQRHVHHIAAPSLEAIGETAQVDAWMIDGDHNYYTVLNELRQADAVGRRDGKPLLAFLHDVSWPCARRDMYYAPERIPAEFRHPYSYENGVTLDNPGVVAGGGFRGGGNFAWAVRQGGARNGVLTAIEDFLAEARGPDRQLAFALVPAVFGLGVIFESSAPWAPAVAELLLPWHDNALLATLERNRLRNYLTVISWQDRAASPIAA